jgi:hypothetical protein
MASRVTETEFKAVGSRPQELEWGIGMVRLLTGVALQGRTAG